MNGTVSRYRQFELLSMWCLCLMLPACQHQGEPVVHSTIADPKITVTETPPRELPTELVVAQAPPLPAQSQAPPVPTVVVEELNPKLASLPPSIVTPTLAQPVGYTPKRSGLAVALEYYLDHRNDEAIAALKHYPTDDQDIVMVMLPLLASIDKGESWMTISGPQKLAFLESLRSLNKKLSKTAPLVMQNVTLVDRQPERYGEIKPRVNVNYYPEEMVYAYAELINLVDVPNAEGEYNVKLDVSLELQGANGTVYWKGTKPFEKQSSISPRSDYHVTARFTLPHHLQPGSYQLVFSVFDREGNRPARQVLPIQVLESRNKTTQGKRRS